MSIPRRVAVAFVESGNAAAAREPDGRNRQRRVAERGRVDGVSGEGLNKDAQN